jgi:sialate O-acetylesterase
MNNRGSSNVASTLEGVALVPLIGALVFNVLAASRLAADVRLPKVLANHMVVQRDLPIRVWGWADPGEQVTVIWDSTATSTVADERGDWKVGLPAVAADAATHHLLVRGRNQIEVNDIRIGEVWLGSGQSNMEMPLTETGDIAAIAAAEHPEVRLFHVTHAKVAQPATDVDAAWQVCTPDNVGTFSALMYYFGVRLQRELNMPIGLINASWGGSPIEQWTPTSEADETMYNGMIAPLHSFPVRGVLWYQGEANVYRNQGMQYFHQMEMLIGGWRKAWRRELPFYFVQIAPWNYSGYLPGQVPVLREAQSAGLTIPNTGMVVTMDLVDPAGLQDGHPRNKREVGERLARWALAKTYGRETLECCGPIYASCEVDGTRLRLHFQHAAGLKSADGEPLREFEIAGANNHFATATALIEKDTVVLESPLVPVPTQARYAWRNLARPNLVNSAGLPAVPFRMKPSGDQQGE